MTKEISYNPFAFILLWLFFAFSISAYSQECGCIDCPLPILDQAISTATFKVNGAQNNSLTSNQVNSVLLKFNHSVPSELEMKLTSPAGQAVTLIGPQATAASAVFFGGFNVSFVTDIADTNPDPGMNTIWNNEDLTGLNQYVGSYLPFSGSLLNFNTGTVNGDWTLEITDPVQFDAGTLEEFFIQFVDQEGIECCEADAGEINLPPLVACQGADTLLLDIAPIFDSSTPSDAIYGYTYIVTENDLIVDISDSPDLRTSSPGLYFIYGFSFDLLDASLIPTPNGTLDFSGFNMNLTGTNPIICGDITDSFLEVSILNGASETFLSDTICAGESVLFAGEEVSITGVYRDTFSIAATCDSIVVLDLLVAQPDTLEISQSTCLFELLGIDTLYLKNEFDCDSLIIINTILLPSDTVYLDSETCNIEFDSNVDTLTIATSECDSVIITTLFYEVPDTIFSLTKTCILDEVGGDTLAINNEMICDDVEVIQTVMYLIDTSYIFLNTCEEVQVGETSVSFATDTCDRIEITVLSFAAADTTFFTIQHCDPSEAGVDTLFLSNQENCDSLVITTTTLLMSDTILLENFSCEPTAVGIDTLILTNQNNCDSLIITTTNLSASDTTFLSALTCDVNQVTPLVETFTTSTCDSIVITEYSFVEPDTTLLENFSCEPTAVGIDTLVLANQNNCDSLIITTTNLSASDTTFLSALTCDENVVGVQIETLEGILCDSIVMTTYTLLASDTTFLIETVCASAPSVTDTILLTNFSGCDSLVITTYEVQEAEPTLLTAFSCDQESLGVDTTILMSSGGCDSLVITNLVFADSDTTYLETQFTCILEEAITDTTVFFTSSCDSVVISVVEFSALDTTYIETSSCGVFTLQMDTLKLVSIQGCDSVVVLNTMPLPSSETLLEVPVMLPSLVGMDTLVLINVFGCDSLVVTNFFLETPIGDTIFIELPTCDETIEIDTSIVGEGMIVITTPIPIFIDTTFLEIPSCDTMFIQNDTTIMSSILGCDSVVVSTYPFLLSIVINLTMNTCDPDQTVIDTLHLEGVNGCDSLIVTQFELIIIDTTFLEETTCDENQERIETIFLTSIDGCDSLIFIQYELIDIDTITTIISTCQTVPTDTINVSGAECPTVQIRIFENLSSDTSYIDIINCEGPFGVDTIELTNSMGCDSIVVKNTVETAQIETVLQAISCQENIPSDTLILSGQTCDSIVITNFIFESLPPTTIELFTCDPTESMQDTILMSSSMQCDSVIIFNTIFVPNEPILNTLETCDPLQVGIDTVIVIGGICDQLIITEYILLSSSSSMVSILTCDPLDVFPDTTILSNTQGCDSLLITEKIFEEIPITEIFLTTCDPLLAGIFIDTLNSHLGCDSIINNTIVLSDQEEEIITQIFTCDIGQVGIDSLFLDQQGCPILMITETLLQNLPDTTYQTTQTCDEALIENPGIFLFTDSNGCDSIVIIEYLLSTFDPVFSAQVTAPDCADEATGEALITTETGIAVEWIFDQSTSLNRSDLEAGAYEVLLSSAVCDTLVLINIPLASRIFLKLEVDYISCSSTGGVIFAQASGGQSPYTYTWQDSVQDSVRQNLTDGTYILTLTDALGCTSVDTAVILNDVGLNFMAKVNNVTCFGFDDGQIDIDILSGTPPYEVKWQDGNMELNRDSLSPAIYSCTITDANDCNIILNRIVREPDILLLKLQTNQAGEFGVLVSGGTPPYDYRWNDGTTSATIEEPISGFGYEVTVTDFNECIAEGEEVFAQVSTSILDESDIQLYPNPHQGDFQFSIDASLRLERIQVYDIYGHIVKQYEFASPLQRFDISMPDLPQGTYILEAHFSQGIHRQKMIIH